MFGLEGYCTVSEIINLWVFDQLLLDQGTVIFDRLHFPIPSLIT